ncbi:CHAT domain-containing protein [Pelagibius sp.]|uniref:CHAT domain-containing protein n=1 Tax=Pelagibius sp. TaxID=1931238 RepID=UPI003B505B8A
MRYFALASLIFFGISNVHFSGPAQAEPVFIEFQFAQYQRFKTEIFEDIEKRANSRISAFSAATTESERRKMQIDLLRSQSALTNGYAGRFRLTGTEYERASALANQITDTLMTAPIADFPEGRRLVTYKHEHLKFVLLTSRTGRTSGSNPFQDDVRDQASAMVETFAVLDTNTAAHALKDAGIPVTDVFLAVNQLTVAYARLRSGLPVKQRKELLEQADELVQIHFGGWPREIGANIVDIAEELHRLGDVDALLSMIETMKAASADVTRATDFKVAKTRVRSVSAFAALALARRGEFRRAARIYESLFDDDGWSLRVSLLPPNDGLASPIRLSAILAGQGTQQPRWCSEYGTLIAILLKIHPQVVTIDSYLDFITHLASAAERCGNDSGSAMQLLNHAWSMRAYAGYSPIEQLVAAERAIVLGFESGRVTEVEGPIEFALDIIAKVVPESGTPEQKFNAVAALGAELVLAGGTGELFSLLAKIISDEVINRTPVLYMAYAGVLAQESSDVLKRNAGSIVKRGRDLERLRKNTDLLLTIALNDFPNDHLLAEIALLVLTERHLRLLDDEAERLEKARTEGLDEQMAGLDQELSRIAMSSMAEQASSDWLYDFEDRWLKRGILEDRLAPEFEKAEVGRLGDVREALRTSLEPNDVLVIYTRYHPYTLDPRTLQFVRSAPVYAAVTLFPDGEVRGRYLAEADVVDGGIRSLRELLLVDNTVDHVAEARSVGSDLYKMLLAPIVDMVSEHGMVAPNIKIVADGMLHLLPFHAMSPDGKTFLVENTHLTVQQIGQIPRPSDSGNLATDVRCGEGALMIANANFDHPFHVFSESGRFDPSAFRGLEDSGQFVMGRRPFLPLWKDAEREVAAVRALDKNLLLMTYDEVNEAQLKQTVFPRIVHMATHGFTFSPTTMISTGGGYSSPGRLADSMEASSATVLYSMHFSGLALAGANTRIGEEDGLLTAAEIRHLDMHCSELVVLSACDTGVGSVIAGEGVFGLRRALYLAGAQSTVTSLWKVSSDSTVVFMEHFYSAMRNGRSPGDALREAQLSMLSDPATSHPYYWAAFVFHRAGL